MKSHQALIAAFAALCCSPALAQTITVNWSQDDYVDFGGAQRVGDLPGPDGVVTFAEAVAAANNTPGPQTIGFAVPLADWWTLFGPDVCVFRQELMAYVSGDDTTIDFTTQTAFTGDTNPGGNEVAFYYAGPPAGIPNIWLAGNRITVKGLDRLLGNNFDEGLWITGNNCRVIGCTTTGLTIRGDYGGGANNTIGGAGAGEGNLFASPVNIHSHANSNVVIGNIFRYGLRVTGYAGPGICDGNRIGGSAPGERNVLAGHGFTGEEGLPLGTELEIFYATNTRVEGNYVGTSDDGLSRYAGRTGAGGIGVGIGAVDTLVLDNTVGGIERTGSGHYQGQRFGIAIGVGASAARTQVRGNRLGVGVDGVTPILNVQGITVVSDPNGTPSNTIIQDNIITTSETTGVRILNAATSRISRNAIFANGALGIDLGALGMTPNDPLDADSGPNALQNFPVLTSALATSSTVRIAGSLAAAPGRSFDVEFFSSPSCDPSGFGEGATYLGSARVLTDAAGLGAIDATLAASVPIGAVLTATATDAVLGNTSEFSACRSVQAAPCAADFDSDGTVDFFDYDAFVNCFEGASCPPGTSADFDADGTVDFFDYDAFVIAFEAGC
ncbi:MAG: hypothetical protein AABZ53_15095 [Planctomycetota bacterium]